MIVFNEKLNERTRFRIIKILNNLYPEYTFIKINAKGIVKLKKRQFSLYKRISVYKLFSTNEIDHRLSKLVRKNNNDYKSYYSYRRFQMQTDGYHDFNDLIEYYYQELLKIQDYIIIIPNKTELLNRRYSLDKVSNLFKSSLKVLPEPKNKISVLEAIFLTKRIKFA